MNRLMKYVFTKREKFLLVVLVVLALGAVWYCGIYAPLEARIRAADTTDLEDEISLEQIKAQKLQAMQAEIDENKAAGLPELQTYNYFKNEVEELNQIFSTATDFNFSFSEPVADGNTVRRDVSVSFGAKNYDAAISMMNEVMNSSCRTMIHDVSVTCGNKVIAAQSENIVDGPVMVSFYMTAYETNIDSNSTEGIGAPAQENSENGGLANADMSDLERSDLETAAEAALEK